VTPPFPAPDQTATAYVDRNGKSSITWLPIPDDEKPTRICHGPRNFPASGQWKKVFLNPTGKPALKVLAQLNDLFQIGGAVPYLAIRKAEPGREPMIVVRCNETGEERSIRVPATDLTEDQAKDHPEAKKELEEFAKERLLKLSRSMHRRRSATRPPKIGRQRMYPAR
jgi:hypothetical protein